MPHYELRKVAIVYKGENLCIRSTKMASTAEAIFYAGESCQRPDLKLLTVGKR